jgi:hypothetical protein
MEIHEGYIVGIYNYCDRWCEACSFTAHCRSFVEEVICEAETDTSMASLVQAPPLPQDVPPPAPSWQQELLDELSNASSCDTDEFDFPGKNVLPAAHRDLCERGDAYTDIVYTMVGSGVLTPAPRDASDPAEVITRLALLIASKTARALRGLAEFDGDREYPPDHEGSAKVALLAIERSLRSWQQIVLSEPDSALLAARATQELEIIREALDDDIPRARAFIRPGFDEPNAIALLMNIDRP